MARLDEIVDLVASWYGDSRMVGALDRGAAAALIDHHGWTPARAAFVAEWIETNPRGRFWAGKIVTLPDVLKNVATLTEQSGADEQAAARPGWQAYEQHEDPAGGEVAQAVEQTFAQKVADVQRPWAELIEEAEQLGLRGPKLFAWVMAERARRTGQQPPSAGAMLRGQGIGRTLPKSAPCEDAPRQHVSAEGDDDARD